MDTSLDNLTLEQLRKMYAFQSGGLWFVSARKASELCNSGILLVDLRPSYIRAGKLPDVPNLRCISYLEIEKHIHLIPRDKPVIMADAVGLRSKETILKLMAWGFDNLLGLAGGIVDWERQGMPTTVDRKEQFSGPCMCQLKKRH